MRDDLKLRFNLINYLSPPICRRLSMNLKRTDWCQAVVLMIAVLGLGRAAADERLADARAAVSKWVDVERTISREALAWEDKKTLLNDLVEVARTEIRTLQQNIAQADKATGVADARRSELVKKRDNNADLAAKIETFLIGVEARLRGLNSRLPKPLIEKLAPLIQRFPSDSQDTELGIAVRMQTVMGYIAEVQRFDTLVTVDEELLPTANGDSREVRTIHFGLGAAFYVTSDDSDAGVGGTSADGWSWTSQPNLAVAIREAIAMAEGKQREARFLSLPVSLKETNK